MIVDAHHHFWRYVRGREAWLDERADFAPLRRNFLGPDLAPHLRTNGVDRTVIVQASNSVEDTAFMVAAAKECPFIAGIVGWLPLDDPKATEKQLEIYVQDPKIKGVRHLILIDPDPNWGVRPKVIESMRLIAERGYTWDSNAGTPAHLEHVVMLAEKIPHLKQVIDHLGKPVVGEGMGQPWTALMTRVAAYPNVCVKLSGIGHLTTVADAAKNPLQPFVDHVIASFGAERVMIASNWPVSELWADYTQTWKATLAMLAPCSSRERDEILGRTAARFYGLDAP